MIVLDTNVLSELMRPAPAEVVMRWFARQPFADLFTTAVTESEILAGVRLLPSGRRRTALESAAAGLFDDLAGHILPFDSAAAHEFAEIERERRRLGRPIFRADAEVASIARSHGARVATRDTADFAGCGVELVNPWVT